MNTRIEHMYTKGEHGRITSANDPQKTRNRSQGFQNTSSTPGNEVSR